MTRALTLLSLGAILAFASTQLLANGNAENGKKKAGTCFACHGTDGNAVDPQYPRLAGCGQAGSQTINIIPRTYEHRIEEPQHAGAARRPSP